MVEKTAIELDADAPGCGWTHKSSYGALFSEGAAVRRGSFRLRSIIAMVGLVCPTGPRGLAGHQDAGRGRRLEARAWASADGALSISRGSDRLLCSTPR